MAENGCHCYAHLERATPKRAPLVPRVVHLFKKRHTVGRDRRCDVTIDSNVAPMTISRRHAVIELTPKGVVIEDVSTNGVFVNDIKARQAFLADGDTVVFSGGKNIPVGARFPQPESEFRFVLRVFARARSADEALEAASASRVTETHLDTLDVQAFVVDARVASYKDIATCLICHLVLCDPVTLSCGHTFCALCHLTWLSQQGRAAPCILCGAPTAFTLSPAVVQQVVDYTVRNCSPQEQADYAERLAQSAPFRAEHPTIYAQVCTASLPRDIGTPWTREQKAEFRKLLRCVSGAVRLCWFARVGLTKHDLAFGADEAFVDRCLDNLMLDVGPDEDLRGKVTALFVEMNAL